MKSTQLGTTNNWLQLIAALAVLVGLVLVFQELRQNNVIATAERISDYFQEGSEIRQFMYENETLLLLQKAVDKPDDLSDAEIARLDSFFEIIWNFYEERIALSALGLLSASVEKAAAEFAWYCQSHLCRTWLEHNWERLMSMPLFLDAVQSELEGMPVPTKFQYLIDLRSAQ